MSENPMPLVMERRRRKNVVPRRLRADIQPAEHIHHGSEGVVRRTKVFMVDEKGQRVGPLDLVEKKFYGTDETRHSVSYSVYKNNLLLAKPVLQFELVLRLRRLNTRLKLGLRFPRTIRLIKHDDGKYSFLMTPLHVVNPYELTPKEEEAFFVDMERQQQTLKRIGLRALKDVFFCVKNQETGEVTAVMADFGTLSNMKEKRNK